MNTQTVRVIASHPIPRPGLIAAALAEKRHARFGDAKRAQHRGSEPAEQDSRAS
jgi:hypothetical protein